MKTPIKRTFLSALAVLSMVVYVGGSRVSLADQNSSENQHEYSHKQKKAFKLGVCVGQTLADQGIMLPFAEEGRHHLDAGTKTAMKKAVRECKKELFWRNESTRPSDSGSSEDSED